MMPPPITWGRWYWPLWAAFTFLTFIIPESIGLIYNWRNTLSAYIWNFERFQQGEPLARWSAPHFLFMCVFITLCIWLTMHFGFGWWRGGYWVPPKK